MAKYEVTVDLNVVRANKRCAHYQRGCKLVTPCCDKIYSCRFCHDEGEAHALNRKEVKEVICTLCDTRQLVRIKCRNCRVPFGKYSCLECNLFDDMNKRQFHCDGCGICRTGGRKRFFHCVKCGVCLPNAVKKSHKCIENVSRANCPVCLEDIHTSRIPYQVLQCGHLLHRNCFDDLLSSGHYACPTCQKSMLDMTELWKSMDRDVAETRMPAEHTDTRVEILCKDCLKKSTAKYHVIGLKCAHCGSYNTCRVKEESAASDS